MAAFDQPEFCRKCNMHFKNWEELLSHKMQSFTHIACIFCGQEFRTVEGRKKHQDQMHAAQQDLRCAGCEEKFIRAGSYINHIEQQLCPVIHKAEFEKRRAEKEVYHQAGILGPRVYNPSQAMISVTSSVTGDVDSNFDPEENLLKFDEDPSPIPWGREEEEDKLKRISPNDEVNFPTLVKRGPQEISGKLQAPLLKPETDKNVNNSAWLKQKSLFPDAPAPVAPPSQLLASMSLKETPKKELHPFDPDNPSFNPEKYYNMFTRKYNCPYKTCNKTYGSIPAVLQHLRSPAHGTEKLRCPSCLRSFDTATALVQHAESQAKKCMIRETKQYREAVDLITGGFVETRGRHEDDTVRYVAPAIIPKPEGGATDGKYDVGMAHESYWDKMEKDRQARIEYQNENTEW